MNKSDNKFHTNSLIPDHAQIHQLNEIVPISLQKSYTYSLEQLIRSSKKQEKEFHLSPFRLQQIRAILHNLDSDNDSSKYLALQELACSKQIEALRMIEEFLLFAHEDLRLWALLAHLQAKAGVLSTLLDEEQIVISSGLGGKDGLMRFMSYIVAQEKIDFEEYQHKLIIRELKEQIEKRKGFLEKVEPYNRFIIYTFLFPLGLNPKETISEVITECNNYGNFVSPKFSITNIDILTEEKVKKELGNSI